jgi:hypothetical protein
MRSVRSTRRIAGGRGSKNSGAAEQGDEADEAFGGMVARMDMPPHARAVPVGRGHRFAAYPRCWADVESASLGGSWRMNGLFRFPEAVRHDPTIDLWLEEQEPDLRAVARTWFQRMRECGGDVREVMHDGCPTACVEDAAFGYVGVFRSHANVGSSMVRTWTIPRACWRALASACGTLR